MDEYDLDDDVIETEDFESALTPDIEVIAVVEVDNDEQPIEKIIRFMGMQNIANAVSYTHLTLPTILLV